jgi:hypothetical protein
VSNKPTKGPWYVQSFNGDQVHNLMICTKAKPGYLPIATMTGCHVDTPVNAHFIVKACNSYESLIEDQARLLLKIASLSGALKDFVEACTDDKRYPTLCKRGKAALTRKSP